MGPRISRKVYRLLPDVMGNVTVTSSREVAKKNGAAVSAVPG